MFKSRGRLPEEDTTLAVVVKGMFVYKPLEAKSVLLQALLEARW